MRSNRGPCWLLAFACGLSFVSGCAGLQGLDEFSIAARASGATELASDESASPAPPSTPTVASALVTCVRNADCDGIGSGASPNAHTHVCAKEAGRCVPVTTPECPRLYGDPTSDDAIVLGALLAPGPTDVPESLERAASIAIAELNEDGGLPPAGFGGSTRPLALVACDTTNVQRAASHLATVLRAPAIVGPTEGDEVISVTQRIAAAAGTLVMAPASPVSAIRDLSDSDRTFRTLPSDRQRARLVIHQVNDLEVLLRATRGVTTVRLAIVVRSDATGTSAREAVDTRLIVNGRFVSDPANAANVRIDAYERNQDGARAAIAAEYAQAFRPDIVLLTAPEQVEDLLVPLEEGLATARVIQRPYYVLTDAAKTQALLDAIEASRLPADIRRRIRGVGMRPDADSAPIFSAFRGEFEARGGRASDAERAAPTYDAVYAIASAALAAREERPTGAGLANGLRMLGLGPPTIVGPTGIRGVHDALAAGPSIALRGTFAGMQWDDRGDVASGTLHVWCVGTSSAAPAFGSAGVTMDVVTQVVGGAFLQCQ